MTSRIKSLVEAFGLGAIVAVIATVAIIGPRPSLGSSPSEVVMNLIERRCKPMIRFGLPLNRSGLESVYSNKFEQQILLDPNNNVALRSGKKDGKYYCTISNFEENWLSNEVELIERAIQESWMEWVNEEAEFRDLSSSSLGKLHLYRPLDGEGRFFLLGHAETKSGLYTTITVGEAKFSD